ncbi:hypothetical protein NE630_03490 [Cloacibacillus evryensis]|uniref:Uncharacterized protein n=1 Tax=Cloacibacillus evryensis TaxID=508460 RepID=A0AAW5K0Q2_9BACT|nr:hypothetical protein [Cloacibacillus evryensis]MCQ4813486.1 hypothetical protein [Cloacibacillus evryensis]
MREADVFSVMHDKSQPGAAWASEFPYLHDLGFKDAFIQFIGGYVSPWNAVTSAFYFRPFRRLRKTASGIKTTTKIKLLSAQ